MRPFAKPSKQEGIWLYVGSQASWHSTASWYPHVLLERMSTWEHFRALLCGRNQLAMSIQKQRLRDVYKPGADRLFSSSSSFVGCPVSANCDDTDNLSLKTLLTLLQKATWDNHKIAIDQGGTAYIVLTVQSQNGNKMKIKAQRRGHFPGNTPTHKYSGKMCCSHSKIYPEDNWSHIVWSPMTPSKCFVPRFLFLTYFCYFL